MRGSTTRKEHADEDLEKYGNRDDGGSDGDLWDLSVSTAQEEKNLEQISSNAKTAADHEAIAAYYEKEAQATHAKHTEHQKMAEWYKKNPTVNKSGFSTHCDLIAANYDKTAKEYEALAKLHKDMAKSGK